MLEVDSSGVVKATGNLEKFKASLKDTEDKAATLDDVMNQFNMSAITGAAGILGLVKAVQGLASGLKNVIGVYSHFESMQKGLETFFQSADLGKQKFDELRKLSNETTFGVDELANSFTQLANVGTDVDTINDKLMMLGNISGGNKQKFADLVSIYSKILSTGKAGSEQIQMLAMRGVPIYDMLKKIGVTGTATGDQITKALQEMTKEGGQFYNAMNNINDTIEGKEGFVSDYIKELAANFAEASGIAEVYKKVLDVVKEALGHVVDALYSINENPVMKAIFQGVLASALTLIVSVIGISLIVALKKVIVTLTAMIAKLTIINILSGPAGWAALAVAGITGVAVGVAGLVKKLDDAKKSADDAAGAIKGMGDGGNGGFTDNKYSSKKELEEAQKLLDSYKISLNDYDGKIKSLTAQAERSFSESEIAAINKLVQQYEGQVNVYTNLIANQNKRIKELEGAAAGEIFVEDSAKFSGDISELFSKTSYGKSIEQIEELERKLNELSARYDVFKVAISDDSRKKVESVIKEWKDELSDMKIKFAVDSQNDWQKVLSKNLKFSDKDIASLMEKGFTGKTAGDLFGEKTKSRNAAEDLVYKKLGYIPSEDMEKERAVDLYTGLKDVLLAIAADENYGVTEKDTLFDSFVPQINQAAEALKSFGLRVDEAGNIIEDSLGSVIGFSIMDYAEKLQNEGLANIKNGNLLKGYSQYAEGASISAGANALQGTDAGNFMQGMAMGGPIVGLINAIIGAIGNVLQSCEGFSDAFNVITNVFKMAKPFFQAIIDIINDLNGGVMTALKPLMGLLNIFGKFLKTIFTFLTPIINFLVSCFGLFEWLGDVMEDFGIVTEESTEKKKEENADLTESYKALLDAMKKNQEEYEKRKKELNASDYASKVTGVHDMILTPNGQFSTDPDDYIIATKNPAGLNGGGGVSVVQLQPIINNTIAGTADVRTRAETDENGMARLVVTVSRKVASDYASGENGWDSAVSSRNSRMSGRSLVM